MKIDRLAGSGSLRRAVLLVAASLVAVALSSSAPQSASAATTAERLAAMAVTEPFDGSGTSVTNFGSNWAALGWSSGTTPRGSDTTEGWRPVDSFATVNGAFYKPTITDAGSGTAAVATMAANPSLENRHFSIWLDMPTPSGVKAGYELKFTIALSGTYTVELSKWQGGTPAALASTSSYSFANGSSFAIVDQGSTVSAWTKTGSEFVQLLSASDSTFSGGNAAIQGSGNYTRLTKFKAAALAPENPPPPPDTTISGGPGGLVLPNLSFTFTSSEAGSSFECSLDGAAYAACTSPKDLQSLAEGTHTFRVRAVGAGGADQTPAERGFQVLQTAKATSKVVLWDSLERQEVPLASANWSKSTWAAAIGGTWMGGYRGYGSSGNLAGAYWNPASFSDGEGTALVAATVGTGATPEGQYLALWLDMPNPGSARSGYEARFTGVNGSASNYKAELAKWSAGTRTVLASSSAFPLAVGTTMVLSETAGGSLTLWTGTSSIAPVLSARDSTYVSGYAGLEVNGGSGTIYNFRAGRIDVQAPETTIESGPSGSVLPGSASFGFASSEAGSSFECSLDGATYAPCTSPKAYTVTAPGSHAFRVRAVDRVGNQDETPAERTFQVVPPPSAVTGSAAASGATQAALHAGINPNGVATTYRFEYGATTSYGKFAPASPKAIGSGNEAVQVAEEIAGLEGGTTYHYRVAATSAAGNSYGEDATFTTPTAPTATTKAAASISADEATLNGFVNPNRSETTYQFEYGTTVSYGSNAPVPAKAVGAGSTGIELSEPIAGLAGGTTYHYRLVATNGVGVTYGEDRTLTTLVTPEATTEPVTAVEANDATLEGTVDPNGSATEYYFEYGKTPSYETVANGEEVGEGTEPLVTSGPVGYLAPETTYHYRVVAVSPAGTDYGQDRTLTTSAPVMTSAEESTLAAAESAFTAGSDNNDPPEDFFGLMWTGQILQTADPSVLAAVKFSNAKMLRLEMSPEGNQAAYKTIFEGAAERGITILPYVGFGVWPTAPGAQTHWINYAREQVEKYGPGGSFWGGHNKYAPHVWEIWNEPNRPENSPGEIPDAAGFGDFFARMAESAKSGVKESSIAILAPGLWGYQAGNCPKSGPVKGCQELPADFLAHMKHSNAYDGISLHPYVFKIRNKGDNKPHAPENRNDAIVVRERVYSEIAGVRNAYPNKPIWITELGFPVDYSGGNHAAVPPVSQAVQGLLVEASFAMLANYRGSLGVTHAFYYNIQDAYGGQPPEEWNGWPYHTGLLSAHGHKRPAWGAFARVAKGKENWSSKRKVKNLATTRKARQATSSFVVPTEGARYRAWGELGSGPTPSQPKDADYPWDTGAVVLQAQHEGESLDESVDVAGSVQYAGLTPSHEYHYRIAVEDPDGEIEYTTGQDFETEPSTRTTATIRTLNGESGWINISGTVLGSEGTINAPDFVNINFSKKEGGVYVFDEKESTHVNISQGSYKLENWKIGKGEWKVNVVYPGFGTNERSESGADNTLPSQEITVKNGYQLVAVHSGKCLGIADKSMDNGASVHQESCDSPANRFNQVFTLVPSPYAPSQYEIVARNSNRCLDVGNESLQDGAAVLQWECLGWGHLNQIWEGVPVNGNSGQVQFVAKHSGKCLAIQAGSSSEGALAVQAPCGQVGEAFRFESVESNQIPLAVSITVDKNDTFNGEPGYVSFHGNVTAGGYDLSGKSINVNFGRETGPETFTPEPKLTAVLPLTAAGHFEYKYWGIGHANWHTRAVFTGEGPLAADESEYRPFAIGSGYRFKFRQSNMCLTTNHEEKENGTALIQWPCIGTAPGSGQVFSVVPVPPLGGNYFQVQPNSVTKEEKEKGKTKCLDVAGGPGATGDGPVIQLWNCLGEAATNQIWHITNLAYPNEAWNSFIAKNSNKCITVSGNSTKEGAQFLQWGGAPGGGCAFAGSQQWEWQGIG